MSSCEWDYYIQIWNHQSRLALENPKMAPRPENEENCRKEDKIWIINNHTRCRKCGKYVISGHKCCKENQKVKRQPLRQERKICLYKFVFVICYLRKLTCGYALVTIGHAEMVRTLTF